MYQQNGRHPEGLGWGAEGFVWRRTGEGWWRGLPPRLERCSGPSTEVGWKPVTVLRVLETLSPRKVVGGAGQPWAGSGPLPPAHTREDDTGCVQAWLIL